LVDFTNIVHVTAMAKQGYITVRYVMYTTTSF